MMTAGYNIKVNIHRHVKQNDDEIGGADSYDKKRYLNVPARLEASRPMLTIMDQGLETIESWQLMIRPLLVAENDEVEVSWPINHRFYGKYLKVIGISDTSMNPMDSRSYEIYTVRRIDHAHSP
jgi:hypothetical protein